MFFLFFIPFHPLFSIPLSVSFLLSSPSLLFLPDSSNSRHLLPSLIHPSINPLLTHLLPPPFVPLLSFLIFSFSDLFSHFSHIYLSIVPLLLSFSHLSFIFSVPSRLSSHPLRSGSSSFSTIISSSLFFSSPTSTLPCPLPSLLSPTIPSFSPSLYLHLCSHPSFSPFSSLHSSFL